MISVSSQVVYNSADNFAYAMLYGMKGDGGKGYPNPEIISGIIDYLKR